MKKKQGEFPEVREDMAYCYHRKSGRVLIHGGWSQKFLDDTLYLDVSSIVGPPYAGTLIDHLNRPLLPQK